MSSNRCAETFVFSFSDFTTLTSKPDSTRALPSCFGSRDVIATMSGYLDRIFRSEDHHTWKIDVPFFSSRRTCNGLGVYRKLPFPHKVGISKVVAVEFQINTLRLLSVKSSDMGRCRWSLVFATTTHNLVVTFMTVVTGHGIRAISEWVLPAVIVSDQIE